MNKFEPKSKKFPKVIRRSFADCSSGVPMVDFSRYVAPVLVYESPMDIMIQNEVCTAVKRVGVHVEKDELLKVLKNDRNQYAEGYRAGYAAAQSEWISVEADQKPVHGKDYLCVCSLPDDPEHKWDWVMVLCWYAYGTNGHVDRPHFTDEGVNGMTVTHWMPLPELPKMSQE